MNPNSIKRIKQSSEEKRVATKQKHAFFTFFFHSHLLHSPLSTLLHHFYSTLLHSTNKSHLSPHYHTLSHTRFLASMTSAPRPINAVSPEGQRNGTRSNTEETLFSSSPRLDAATRLLSTSPSPRPSSRNNNNNSNNNNHAFSPSSSWRSPSTLQNFRRLSTDGYQSGGESNNNINRLSSNAPVVGSYQSIYSLNADTPYSGMEISADEASKVVKKHLVLSARNSFESDRDRDLNHGVVNGGGYDTGDESGNESGPGSRSRAAPVDYNAAFKLPGGAITRDVYKWQADQENEQFRRGGFSFLVVDDPTLLKSFFFGSCFYCIHACMQDTTPHTLFRFFRLFAQPTNLLPHFVNQWLSPRSPLSTFFLFPTPDKLRRDQKKKREMDGTKPGDTTTTRPRPPNHSTATNEPGANVSDGVTK